MTFSKSLDVSGICFPQPPNGESSVYSFPILKGYSKDKLGLVAKCVEILRMCSLYKQSMRIIACHHRTHEDSESQSVLDLWVPIIIVIDKKKYQAGMPRI